MQAVGDLRARAQKPNSRIPMRVIGTGALIAQAADCKLGASRQ